jgi:hypothetical protein
MAAWRMMGNHEKRVLTTRYLYLLHYRDDFGSKQVERLQVVDILKAEDSLVDAHRRQGREELDSCGGGCCAVVAIARQVDAIEAGFLDPLVWTIESN